MTAYRHNHARSFSRDLRTREGYALETKETLFENAKYTPKAVGRCKLGLSGSYYSSLPTAQGLATGKPTFFSNKILILVKVHSTKSKCYKNLYRS